MALERGGSARASLTKFARKLSIRNREYNKVEDLYDTRIPLHNEEAFQHGIQFKAKFIGSLEIAKPSCKIDIITAMRRIRYEYKVKGIRKIRCNISIAVGGVKISKRKGKRSRKRYSEEQLFIMQHPIYRIFYVSHDSQDLKIFSYITREVPNNTFRCNVFKAYKKGTALSVVRSLGQAFDVCHKLNPRPKKKKDSKDSSPETESSSANDKEGSSNKEKKPEENGISENANTQGQNGQSAWKQFEDSTEKPKNTEVMEDLLQLNFDPFTAPGTLPQSNQNRQIANGGSSNVDPFQPAGVGGAYPMLTMGNTSMALPDFPDGVDPAVASANVPPPHMALLGRPRPRPTSAGHNQVITENKFTDPNASIRSGTDSPVSIGEALDSSTHRRTTSNPFQPISEEQTQWEQEKSMLGEHMRMMKEQLDSEKAARIQSQARVEHLLTQNKDLLAHLQTLMTQLSQIQALQQSLGINAGASASGPAAAAGAVAAPPPPTSDMTQAPSAAVPTPAGGSAAASTTEVADVSAPLSPPFSSTPIAEHIASTSPEHQATSSPATSNAANMSLELDLSILGGPATNDPFLPPQTANDASAAPVPTN